MKACIFAGPTLPPGDEARALSAIWLPPAKHGDVYRVVTLLRPQAIAIVDGYFQWAPSVWHKEILWALHEGVHVFGAASMGALRAAELWSLGMRGVGRIFEAYRDGVLAGAGDTPFEDDDEVAVVHGPPESGYIAASEAMVNIRCTLADAERAGVIGGVTRQQLVTIAKDLYFPERCYETLFERARAAALPGAQLDALRAWLPAGRVNQKRADAIAMLAAVQGFLASDPAPARTSAAFEHTSLWDRAVRDLRPGTTLHLEESQALDELRLDSGRFEGLQQAVVAELLAAPGEGAARHPQATGCEAGHELEEAERREAMRCLQEQIPAALLERQIVARIRKTREFASLLARARDKRIRLAGRTDLPRAEDFSDLQLLQLRSWFFSQSPGGDMPDDLERYLHDMGYPDITCFHDAVFAEYVYRQTTGGAAAGTAAGNR